MPSNKPIGIFDSGIGGLTIAHSISQLLPNEELIFFGDTAHLPYGNKSARAVKHYADKIVELLLKRSCKIIVIACNTASSVAFNDLNKKYGDQSIIINVINPVVQYALDAIQSRSIGIIGTKRTISSRAYPKKIKELNPTTLVSSMATPLLAQMIEEGFYNNNISKAIIHDYLSRKTLQDIDSLILGCTHYPLIKDEINDYYKGIVHVLDSTDIVAMEVKNTLGKYDMRNESGKVVEHNFYVSDFTSSFQETTKIFFKEQVPLKEFPIWDFDQATFD
ncbi:MAG: glutamate racemase [Bacteroidetes bacterium]|nr:glutamate racemase [Bacteroidota bacterium]